MSDDDICENLNNNFFQGVMALGEAVEEEVEVVIREVLVAISILP